jgi:plasmid maintenance system antidote protein VapI
MKTGYLIYSHLQVIVIILAYQLQFYFDITDDTWDQMQSLHEHQANTLNTRPRNIKIRKYSSQ